MSSASLPFSNQHVSSTIKKESDKMLATGGAGTAYMYSIGNQEGSQSFKADAFLTSDHRQDDDTKVMNQNDTDDIDDDVDFS